MRNLPAVLCAAVLIAGVPMGGALAADSQSLEQAEPIPAGEVQTVAGGCDVKVSISELLVTSPPGPLLDDHVELRVFQRLNIHGFGYPPNATVNFLVDLNVDEYDWQWDASTDANGYIVSNWGLLGDDPPSLPWDGLVIVYDPAPGGCRAFVNVRLLPATPFTDIAGGFHRDIVWLYQSGVTGGCTATLFCPKDAVTREQMASFLARALNLPATSTNYFSDDDSSIHHAAINRLAAAGITGGCTATSFCPKDAVTREQMASFLARALKLPATSTNYFSDDDSSIHHAAINRLAAALITGGCTATRYCPKDLVTREQMAAFLHRALHPRQS
jgi:hypothetical protein